MTLGTHDAPMTLGTNDDKPCAGTDWQGRPGTGLSL